MLEGLSLKWLPFYVLLAAQTILSNRFFPERACDSLLTDATANTRTGKLVFHGSQTARSFLAETTRSLNNMLEGLAVEDLNIYAVEGQRVIRSFYVFDRLFLGTGDLDSDREKTGIVFSHEFGHAVWAKHFRIHFNGKSYSTKSLANEVAILERRGLINDPSYLVLKKIERSLQAYNEVFADLVAILFTTDVNAIARVHGFPSALELGLSNDSLEAEMLDEVKWRSLDFTAKIDSDMWEKYLAERIIGDPKFKSQLHYRVLAPVRGEIGRVFLPQLTLGQRGKFLRLFMDAANEHLLRRGAEAAASISETNSRVNSEFIQILSDRVRGAVGP